MKKKLLLLSFALMPFLLNAAATEGTVIENLSEGTLLERVGDIESLNGIESLTISGRINGTDILVIRNMHNLKAINLADASIVEGGQPYYKSYTTKNNELGDYMLYDLGLEQAILPRDLTLIGQFSLSKNQLSSIEIPEKVTRIGNNAFASNRLSAVTFPPSVTEMGYEAFSENAFVEFAFPPSLKELKSYILENNKQLLKVTIPGSITRLHSSICWGCTSLKQLILEDGTENLYISLNNTDFKDCPLEYIYIGRNIADSGISEIKYHSAFDDIPTLKKAEFGNITKIPSYMFYYCENLAEFSLPGTLKSIGWCAFESTAIEKIVIPESVTYIEYYAFESSPNLREVDIKGPLRALPVGIFADCNKLEKLTLPSTISKIETGSLSDTPIQEFRCPDDLVEIGDNAFYGCKNLERIHFNDKLTHIGDRAFQNCSALKEIYLPESLTSLDSYSYAFSNCESLRVLSLPATLEKFDIFSIVGSINIISLISHAVTPPTVTEDFDTRITENCTLYVPDESYALYYLHQYWGKFRKIVKLSEYTGIDTVTRDSTPFSTGNGKIIIPEGNNKRFTIFNMQGQVIYDGIPTSEIECGHGLFIIKTPDAGHKVRL